MPEVKSVKTAEDLIQDEVNEIFSLETNLKILEDELATNELFQRFLTSQKAAQKTIRETWANIEKQMIEHNVKSIKGDWGYITIAERLNWSIDEAVLPPRYFKRVPDTTRISTMFRLNGEPPKGATPSYTKYLTKKIKEAGEA